MTPEEFQQQQSEQYEAIINRLRSIDAAIRMKPADPMTIADGIRMGIGMFIVLPILVFLLLWLLSAVGIGVGGFLK
jgi:hypothetical protein